MLVTSPKAQGKGRGQEAPLALGHDSGVSREERPGFVPGLSEELPAARGSSSL